MSTILGFFSTTPASTMVLCYLVGMILIGYPMGYFSLKVWLEPHRTFLSFLLFPWKAGVGSVGYDVDPNATFMSLIHATGVTGSVLYCESKDNLEIRAKYVAATMLFWLPRAVVNIVMLILLAAFLAAVALSQGFIHVLSKFLLSFSKCLDV